MSAQVPASFAAKKAKKLVDRIDDVKLQLFITAINASEKSDEYLKAVDGLHKANASRLRNAVRGGDVDRLHWVKNFLSGFKDALKDEVMGHVLRNYFLRLHPSVKDRYASEPPRSVIFLGPPGVGKSERVRDAAMLICNALNLILKDEEPWLEFIELSSDNFRNIVASPDKYFVLGDIRLIYYTDPSEIRGIPLRSHVGDGIEAVVDVPSMYSLVFSLSPGVMFLDELTNADQMTLNAAYQILLDHKISFIPIHNDVIVIGAGNTREYSVSANVLPKPILTRADVKEVKPPKVDDWRNYMDQKHRGAWDVSVYRYLKLKWFFEGRGKGVDPPIGPDGMILDAESFEKHAEQKPYPSPRSWTAFAIRLHQIKQLYGDEIMRDIVNPAAVSDEDRRRLAENVRRELESIIGGEAFESFLRHYSMVLSCEPLIAGLYVKSISGEDIDLDRYVRELKDYGKALISSILVTDLVAKLSSIPNVPKQAVKAFIQTYLSILSKMYEYALTKRMDIEERTPLDALAFLDVCMKVADPSSKLKYMVLYDEAVKELRMVDKTFDMLFTNKRTALASDAFKKLEAEVENENVA